MFLPAEYFWLEPVLIAAVVVFLVSLLGNLIAFGNRLANAVVTAIVFGLIFGALSYYGYGDVQMRVSTTPSTEAPASQNSGGDSNMDTDTQMQ